MRRRTLYDLNKRINREGGGKYWVLTLQNGGRCATRRASDAYWEFGATRNEEFEGGNLQKFRLEFDPVRGARSLFLFLQGWPVMGSKLNRISG